MSNRGASIEIRRWVFKQNGMFKIDDVVEELDVDRTYASKVLYAMEVSDLVLKLNPRPGIWQARHDNQPLKLRFLDWLDRQEKGHRFTVMELTKKLNDQRINIWCLLKSMCKQGAVRKTRQKVFQGAILYEKL